MDIKQIDDISHSRHAKRSGEEDDFSALNSMLHTLTEIPEPIINNTDQNKLQEIDLTQQSLEGSIGTKIRDKDKIEKLSELINSQTQYRVVSLLNEGGQGFIYVVRDSVNGQLKIAKCLKDPPIEALMCEEVDMPQYLREVDLPNRLKHKGLAQIDKCLRLEDQSNRSWITLISDYDAPTHSLKDLIADNQFTTPREVVDLLCSTLEILRDIHDPNRNHAGLRIIHSDIKPGNILIKGSGEISLIDLGVARQIVEGETHLHTISFRGTPWYTAMEQFLGNGIPASDIYSLGVTAIQCLLREIPQGLKVNIKSDKPYRLPEESPIPERLKDILNTMVHPDAEKRFANAQLALNALLPLKDEKTLLSPREATFSTETGTVQSVFNQLVTQILTPIGATLRGLGSLFNHNLSQTTEWTNFNFSTKEKSSFTGLIRSLLTHYNKMSIAASLPKDTLNSDATKLFENVSAVLAGGFSSYANQEFIALKKEGFQVNAKISSSGSRSSGDEDFNNALITYSVLKNGVPVFFLKHSLYLAQADIEKSRRQMLKSFSSSRVLNGGLNADTEIKLNDPISGAKMAAVASTLVAILADAALSPNSRLVASAACPNRGAVSEENTKKWGEFTGQRLIDVAWVTGLIPFAFGRYTSTLHYLERATRNSPADVGEQLTVITSKLDKIAARLAEKFPSRDQKPRVTNDHEIENELIELRLLHQEACSICRSILLSSDSPLTIFIANNTLQELKHDQAQDKGFIPSYSYSRNDISSFTLGGHTLFNPLSYRD
jgi:serine/threonine protein kinase